MSSSDGAGAVERFRPTSGRTSGIAGLVAGGAFLLLAGHAISRGDYANGVLVVLLALLGLLLVWSALLRPALWAVGDDLVMRGMFHTDRVPLAAIDQVAVSQVLTVSAGERRLVSPVIGYSARQNVRSRLRPDESQAPGHQTAERQTPERQMIERPFSVLRPGATQRPLGQQQQQLVEARITQLAEEARLRHADTTLGVRREWAWPILVAGAVLAVAVVVCLLVR